VTPAELSAALRALAADPGAAPDVRAAIERVALRVDRRAADSPDARRAARPTLPPGTVVERRVDPASGELVEQRRQMPPRPDRQSKAAKRKSDGCAGCG
jgi:hypothetical protein